MNASREGWTLAGSIAAALTASACCITPVVFALLGIGGAAFAVALEPYRPLFIGLTLMLLGGAFYFVYRSPAAPCGADGSCAANPRRTRLKTALWIVTAVVLAALAFPYYINYLI